MSKVVRKSTNEISDEICEVLIKILLRQYEHQNDALIYFRDGMEFKEYIQTHGYRFVYYSDQIARIFKHCTITMDNIRKGAFMLKYGKIEIYFGNKINIVRQTHDLKKELKKFPKIIKEHYKKEAETKETETKETEETPQPTINLSKNNNICYVCDQQNVVNSSNGKHLCHVKITFGCMFCDTKWSTKKGVWDRQLKEPVFGSKCKTCKQDGYFVSKTKRVCAVYFHICMYSNQVEPEILQIYIYICIYIYIQIDSGVNNGPHLSEFCSGCIEWGDCQAIFLQIATIIHGIGIKYFNKDIHWYQRGNCFNVIGNKARINIDRTQRNIIDVIPFAKSKKYRR